MTKIVLVDSSPEILAALNHKAAEAGLRVITATDPLAETIYYRSLDGLIDDMAEKLLPKPRPSKKCRLPGCENMTNHNGGFCCAEHCLEHRKR